MSSSYASELSRIQYLTALCAYSTYGYSYRSKSWSIADVDSVAASISNLSLSTPAALTSLGLCGVTPTANSAKCLVDAASFALGFKKCILNLLAFIGVVEAATA